MSTYRLQPTDDTTDEFPTRCTNCNSPIERLSVFPKQRCIDCHAAVTPMPTAEDVVNAWKGQA